MKSERRHELQQNVLDAELGKVVGFFKKNGRYVLWAAFGVALILFVWMLYSRGQESKERARQDLFVKMAVNRDITDETLPALEDGISADPNKFRAAALCVAGGEYCIRSVLTTPTLSAEERQKKVEKADGFFRRAISEFPGEKSAAACAELGLACLEEMTKGPEAAKAQMAKAAELKDTMAGMIAKADLADLSSEGGPVRLRQAPLEVPTSQPADLLAPAAAAVLPDVPLPQGFTPMAPTTAPVPAGEKRMRFASTGDMEVLRVVRFYRWQMPQRRWRSLGDDLTPEGGTELRFGKGKDRCTILVTAAGTLKAQIEIRSSVGPELPPVATAPAAPAVPATGPAAVAVPASTPGDAVKK